MEQMRINELLERFEVVCERLHKASDWATLNEVQRLKEDFIGIVEGVFCVKEKVNE